MSERDETEESANKKKKGGKEEAGAGRTEVAVSQGFYEKMGLLGASSGLVAEILKTWRHLQGESLMQRLRAFMASRASAHVEVDIKKNKDYGLLHNLFQHIKGLPRALTHAHKIDPRNTPGPK